MTKYKDDENFKKVEECFDEFKNENKGGLIIIANNSNSSLSCNVATFINGLTLQEVMNIIYELEIKLTTEFNKDEEQDLISQRRKEFEKNLINTLENK